MRRGQFFERYLFSQVSAHDAGRDRFSASANRLRDLRNWSADCPDGDPRLLPDERSAAGCPVFRRYVVPLNARVVLRICSIGASPPGVQSPRRPFACRSSFKGYVAFALICNVLRRFVARGLEKYRGVAYNRPESLDVGNNY